LHIAQTPISSHCAVTFAGLLLNRFDCFVSNIFAFHGNERRKGSKENGEKSKERAERKK
jgi:hypothetical protein